MPCYFSPTLSKSPAWIRVAERFSFAVFFSLNLLQQHWMQNAFSFNTSALLASRSSSCSGEQESGVKGGTVLTILPSFTAPWCLSGTSVSLQCPGTAGLGLGSDSNSSVLFRQHGNENGSSWGGKWSLPKPQAAAGSNPAPLKGLQPASLAFVPFLSFLRKLWSCWSSQICHLYWNSDSSSAAPCPLTTQRPLHRVLCRAEF